MPGERVGQEGSDPVSAIFWFSVILHSQLGENSWSRVGCDAWRKGHNQRNSTAAGYRKPPSSVWLPALVVDTQILRLPKSPKFEGNPPHQVVVSRSLLVSSLREWSNTHAPDVGTKTMHAPYTTPRLRACASGCGPFDLLRPKGRNMCAGAVPLAASVCRHGISCSATQPLGGRAAAADVARMRERAQPSRAHTCRTYQATTTKRIRCRQCHSCLLWVAVAANERRGWMWVDDTSDRAWGLTAGVQPFQKHY